MGNTCCLGREKPPAPPAALAESEASKGCTRRLLCPTLCGGRAHAGPATTRPHAGRGVVAAARPAAAEASAFSWPFLWANQVLQQFRGWASKRKLVEAATARPGSTTGQWIRWPGTQLCTWCENSSGPFFLLARGSAEQGKGDDTRGHGQRPARPAAAEASAFSWPFLWANQVLQQFRGWAPKRKLVEAATARPGSTTGQWIRWPGTQLCTWCENSSGPFFLLARGSAEQGKGDDTRGHGQRLRHEGPTHHTFHARLMSCISLCIGRLAARPASLLGASRQRDNREETSESGLPAAMRAV